MAAEDHDHVGARDEGDADVIAFPSPATPTPPERDVGLRVVIGEVLREERHRQRRTLADVAGEAAVSVQYLSEVERGRKEVSSDLLTAVHRALGIELGDVLERAGRRLHVRPERGHGLRMLAA